MDEWLKEKRYIARVYILRHNPFAQKEDAEDFCSFCTELWLQDRRKKASIEQLYIDYVRMFGIGKYHKKPSGLEFSSVEYNPDTDDTSKLNQEILTMEAVDMGPIGRLKNQDRVIAILYFHWGFTAKEIGYCYGVTESAIALHLKEIYVWLKTRTPKPKKRLQRS